jgi:hypothetical protein
VVAAVAAEAVLLWDLIRIPAIGFPLRGVLVAPVLALLH